MLSVLTLLAAAICTVPVSGISRRNVIHGRQLFLDLPERTKRLDFTSADERDQFTIWEHKSLSIWPSKPSKGQVNSASNGWSFTIRHVTFDDEGTYTLLNHFGSTISSYMVKVNTNREIIERIAGEKLIIPLLGLKQSDATLHFYGNYSSVILVENGVPVGKNKPDYINRLKVTSEMIQVLNVNVSDLGRYELTDYKGRCVSNNTMVLVDQHAHNPSQGFLALMLLGIPCGICFCCRRRICNRCRTTKSQTVESNILNTVPVSVPCSNTVIDPVGPIGPGGPGQGYIAGYPSHPDQGQIHYPPPTEWSGQPAVSPNPWKSGTIRFVLLMTLLFESGSFLTMERGFDVDHTNVTSWCSMPKACDEYAFTDWFKVGRYCVKYFDNPVNFTNAEFKCRSKAPGAHLVSVHSKKDNADLLCLVNKMNPGNLRFWLGGFEFFKSGHFFWLDGSYWNYQIWTSGEPNHMYTSTEECLEMNWKEIGKWNDDSCSVKKNYICAFKRNEMLKVDQE